MRVRHLASGITVSIAISLGGPAVADTVDVPYRATLAGVEVGAGLLSIEVADDKYRVVLEGLLFGGGERTGIRVNAQASGTFLGRARNVTQPDLYVADVVKAGAPRRIGVAFQDGAVGAVAVLPPSSGTSGGTRPAAAQARAVMDPLSALMLPAANLGLAPLSSCGRTQRVFDGLARYDVQLFPSRVETVAVGEHRLTAVICRAELKTLLMPPPRLQRWPELRPQGRQAVVALAPVAEGRLLVPVRVESKLALGTLVIEATDARPFGDVLRPIAAR
jgi:hypothetical protein